MKPDCSDYQPMILADATIETLKSPKLERFIIETTIEPGIRLLLRRARLRPDWPFVDTKFNPNSGADLPADGYNVIYCWFLGRGSEALAGHLPIIDSLAGLSPAEKDEAKTLFGRLVATMTDAITRIREANRGRCPFRVNRELRAIDADGRPIAMNPEMRSAGDTFCAKGLIAEGSPENVRRGVEMLLECAKYVRLNAYGSDQGLDLTGKIGQGEKMLMQAVPPLIQSKTGDRESRTKMYDMTAEFMEFVLDKHFDPATGVFAEYIDSTTQRRQSYLDPGHANEFVGLGLGAAETLGSEKGWLTPARAALLARARAAMPRMLVKATELGWNAKFHGLHKAVDTATGQVVIDDMPWWNLPETMRAAVRAVEVTSDPAVRKACLECYRLAHNAYFEHFLNRGNLLFPYQTRSGATGEVVNKVPAVPEGDPLYHTNLAMLDMLAVIRRLR